MPSLQQPLRMPRRPAARSEGSLISSLWPSDSGETLERLWRAAAAVQPAGIGGRRQHRSSERAQLAATRSSLSTTICSNCKTAASRLLATHCTRLIQTARRCQKTVSARTLIRSCQLRTLRRKRRCSCRSGDSAVQWSATPPRRRTR